MMRTWTVAGTLLVLAGLPCCNGFEPEDKKSVPALIGLKDYPAVQVHEAGGGEDFYGLFLNLEGGTFKVQRGETAGHLATFEGTCTADELAEGRELFAQSNVELYEAESIRVLDEERRLKVVVIWPEGAPESTSTFTLSSSSPPAALEQVTGYTRRYFDLYAPPVPTTDPVDAHCPDGDLCPDVPPPSD